MSEKTQYIGRKKIKDIKDLDYRTPQGATMVEVTYEDGEKEVMSHPRFSVIVTNEESDLGEVREKLKKKLGGMMYAIMVEYDIRMGEGNDVVNAVGDLINNASVKSINKMWNVDHSDDRSLIMINNVLLENDKNEKGDNGSSSDGEGTSTKDKK